MAKLTLTTIGSRYGSVDALNANFDAIEQAFQDVLYRDGSTPNFMEANLDMNGYSILNLDDLVVGGVNISSLNSALVWRGTWSGATAYAVSDAVYYNGSSYICKIAHTNQVPPNATFWDVLAAQGATGPGSGDVVGPASSSTDNITTYASGTGKLVKDSGIAISSVLLTSNIGTSVQAYDVDTVKKDVANTFTATQTPDNGTAAVSTTSSYVFDGADQIREITLTNAITVTFGAPTGITQFAMYKFLLKAGDTSARTFAWNSAYKFPSATSPLTSGTTTNGAFDIITFIGGASNTLIYDGVQRDVR